MSVRLYLLGLLVAALLPVWLFAAYLLVQYALNERTRFEREALQAAQRVSLVVDGELNTLLAVVEGLSKSAALTGGDLAAVHAEATRLVQGTDRVLILRETGGRRILETTRPFGAELPPAPLLSADDLARVARLEPLVSGVYNNPTTGEIRIAVATPVRGPGGEDWLLAVSVPTSRIRDVVASSATEGFTIGVGDRAGGYIARSALHDQFTGKPGLPEYLAKVVGRSGTFTSRNFQGETLLAGYYRSTFSGWFFTANVALTIVQAPLWRSLAAIGAIGLVAMLLSVALAYAVGNRFARGARDLAALAEALGAGRPLSPIHPPVTEFAVIADALTGAERGLAERRRELEVVLETVPAAVWFTYDPMARQVIRNRFAAELMGLPSDRARSFGAPETVIDTIALKDGAVVSRDDRPLSRAMRGDETDNEEFAYLLPGGRRSASCSLPRVRSAAQRARSSARSRSASTSASASAARSSAGSSSTS